MGQRQKKGVRGPWSALLTLTLLVATAGCASVGAPTEAPASPGVSGPASPAAPPVEVPAVSEPSGSESATPGADLPDPVSPADPTATPAPAEGAGAPSVPAPDNPASASPPPADEPAASDVPASDSGAEGRTGDLVIPIAEITEQASFYPVEVNGTWLEVIAVKAPDGTLRTAFNTCQICYDSGQGYYKQEGNALVCQNCGSLFTMDRVEKAQGGCNPVPIYANYKTVDEENITISGAFLEEATVIFQNWKSS